MFERFAPTVTLPLSFILVAAASKFSDLSNKEFFTAWISAFCILFILRAVDDLTDIHVDKTCHPERLLVSGKINQRKFINALLFTGGLVFCLNFREKVPLFITGLMLLYALIFYYKSTIPAVFRIPLINVIFLILPIYVGVTGYSTSWTPLILLGLFIWISTIAHDIAHSIHERTAVIVDTSSLLINANPRQGALLATTMFMIAAGVGFLFWWCIGQPLLFIMLLGTTLAQVFYLSIKLIRNPHFATARPFYIYGFTFFLIPLIGLTLNSLLGILREFYFSIG